MATVVTAAARRRLAVLSNGPFRRLLSGRTVSVLGDGLYAVAAMWLVYDLTGSTAYTGLAGFLARAPAAAKFAVGPLVDRAPLDRVLTGSEFAQALLVLAVPVVAVLGRLHVAVVLAVMPLLAVADLVSGPAQNAALPRLVDDDALVRANSAFSVATSAVDAAARGVAGVVVAAAGAVALYVVDAVTFLLAGLLFASLSVPHEPDDDGGLDLDAYLADLREGVALLAGSVAGLMLVGSLFANFLAGAALAVLPAFADSVGGAETYGLLLAGMTGGAVLGSVGASAVDRLPLGATTILGFLLSACCWTGAVLVPGRLPTALLFAASRVPLGAYNVFVLSTFQTAVPDDLLGRVTATTSSATNVVMPAGLLAGGAAGTLLGARTAMLAGALGTALAACYWLAVPSLRRFGPPTEVAPGEFA